MEQLEQEVRTETLTFKQALGKWLRSMKTKVKILMVNSTPSVRAYRPLTWTTQVCYQLVSSVGFNCDVAFPVDCE